MRDHVADRAAECDRDPGAGRLDSAPCTEREADMLAALHAHRRAQRANREQAAAESDQQGADPEQQRGLERRREHDCGEGWKPEHGTGCGHAHRIRTSGEQAGGQREGGEGAAGEQRGQPGGGTDRQVQHFSAVGLQHDVLHVERHRAQADGPQEAARLRLHDEHPPGRTKAGRIGRTVTVTARVARLLLPQRDGVEQHAEHRSALDHLHQPGLGEIRECHAENDAGTDHADQQHHVHQGDHARPGLRRRKVGGQREAGGLGGLHACPDHQERHRRTDVAEPDRTRLAAAGQEQ